MEVPAIVVFHLHYIASWLVSPEWHDSDQAFNPDHITAVHSYLKSWCSVARF